MTDKKITEWYTANPVTLDPGDIFPVTENTGTTPATGAAKASQLMFNRYKITPSVASSNLTVALKHEDGTNPSTDRPLYFKIGDTLRAVTGALSVTKNAGTNWCNAGSSELAAKEIDYFVYIGYNATDGVTIGFSRIPYANLYSDFSATTTNEKYAAISTITTAAAGNDYVNIGRFAATLSAGAGYTWTIPTYTSTNLKNRPTYESRLLTWQPTLSNLTLGNGSNSYKYKVTMTKIDLDILFTLGSTSAVSGDVTLTLPFANTQDFAMSPIFIQDVSVGGVLGVGFLYFSSLYIRTIGTAGSYANIANFSATVPFTWTTGDNFGGSLSYSYTS